MRGFVERIKWAWRTEKVLAYGICSNRMEMLCYHFAYLIYGIFLQFFYPGKYESLIIEIEDEFKKILWPSCGEEEVSRGKVMVTQSCRTIFYCIIRSLLKKNRGKLKICTLSVHAGCFSRILKRMNLERDVEIELYEIDLNINDWTLDVSSVNEDELRSCDMVLCMHCFGVPLDQDILFELGHKFNIPVIEDCVLSGSLYSNYKGHALSDIGLWSGGLDKTPSCMGGGFGYFKDTQHGNDLYESVECMISGLRVDSWFNRATKVNNMWIHMILAKNYFFILSIAGYVGFCIMGESTWNAFLQKVRYNEALAPFGHAEAYFLCRPSIYQLLSIRYGINKDYSGYAAREIAHRDLFLENIPKKYQKVLFPWLTDDALQRMRDNKGISELTWVYAGQQDRARINDYCNDRGIITIINTTFDFYPEDVSTLKMKHGQRICENLTCLPNVIQQNERQVIGLAKVLTDYCIKYY